MKKYRYFTEEEFRKLTPPCSLDDMCDDFMQRLDNARHIAGIPFVLSCAYRSREWDKSKGRTGTGYHTSGRAVDIICTRSKDRMLIIDALISAGITGIGIAKTYIHADDRVDRLIYLY